MPDGRTHDEITLVTAAFAAPIALVNVFAAIGDARGISGAHVLSGLLFSDDLDIDSIEFRRWVSCATCGCPTRSLCPTAAACPTA